MSKFANLKSKVMECSRLQKLEHFYSIFEDGESVLDVGVSSESKAGPPSRNYFLKQFRYDPSLYTGLGVQDLSGMDALFPGKRFVQYPGGRFPFEDKEFDWVFSNAVIEHVGDRDAQVLFINEMLRVAHNVFFTTPNKFFPVESHTNVFFIHWHDGIFFDWCRKKNLWANRNNLNLLTHRHLQQVLSRSKAKSFSICSNRLVGLPMTFSITCT